MLAAASVVPALAADQVLLRYKFAENSVLAQGKWVKVEVETTGVYEISYDELRSMGFDNPENVSVFGAGGTARDCRLYVNGMRTQSDDPEQKPVWHDGNKLYFYGAGVDHVKIRSGKFERQTRNIYTNKGHYYLTDSAVPMNIKTVDAVTDDAADCNIGLGYVYHEVDKMFGIDGNNKGQQFFEYSIRYEDPRSWTAQMPGFSTGGNATLYVNAAQWVYGNSGNNNFMTVTVGDQTQKKALYAGTRYITQTLDFPLTPSGDAMTFTLGMSLGNGDAIWNTYLDNWVLNYTKDMSKPTGAAQSLYAYTGGGTAASGWIAGGSNIEAWDVTDPAVPTALKLADDRCYFARPADVHTIVKFDKSKTQLKVSNPQPMANQNLHGLQKNKYALIIVTMPELREYAEQIAELHRKHDGIEVLTVTPQECYDEFTSGNPDPVAIRMLAKMIYQGQGNNPALRNILLFGPIGADLRNITGFGSDKCIIAVQENLSSFTTMRHEPLLINDYYGMMTDNPDLSSSSIYNQVQQLGVGTLHVSTAEEARTAVGKIRNYLEGLDSSDMAWMVNETLSMSVTGDDHVHDVSVRDVGNYLQSLAANRGGALLHSVLMPDFYRDQDLRKPFIEKFNRGKLYNVFLGHAHSGGLNVNIVTSDIANNGSRIPGFMLFGGCDTTDPQRGWSGVGSAPVLSARGLAGSVASTTEAWSDNNEQLARQLAKAMFCVQSGANRIKPVTIGEIYANAKTALTQNFNEAVFIYVGDPALTFPSPLYSVRLDVQGDQTGYAPGDVITVSGGVYNSSASVPDYNGKVVLKLCAPATTLNQVKYPGFTYEFTDIFLTAQEAEVKDGKFTAKIIVPEAVRPFMKGAGESMLLYAGAYCPDSRIGASGKTEVALQARGASADPAAVRDTTAPGMSLGYDSSRNRLNVSATDDTALIPGVGNGGAVSLTVDGRTLVNDDALTAATAGTGSYQCTVGLADFAPGAHKAQFRVTDMAGNVSNTQTLDFTIPAAPAFKLEAEHTYALDSVNFRVTGTVGDGLMLRIYDAEGNMVYETECTSSTMTWDCSEMPAGAYRAAVMYTDGRVGASDFAPVQVID